MDTTYLIFDVETTGLIIYKDENGVKVDLNDPRQPHITQISASIYAENGEVIQGFSTYIKPDGWTVPPVITELNGLTTEFLEKEGEPIIEGLKKFQALKDIAAHRASFNLPFDKKMLKREELANNIIGDSSKFDDTSICIMQMTTDVCKMPPTESMMRNNRKGYKTPKLKEAYEIITGKKLENAHNAMYDVLATAEIFFKMLKDGVPPVFSERKPKPRTLFDTEETKKACAS